MSVTKYLTTVYSALDYHVFGGCRDNDKTIIWLMFVVSGCPLTTM